MKQNVLPYGVPRAGGPGVIPEKGNYRPGFGDPPLEAPAPLHQAEGHSFKPQVMVEDGVLSSKADHTAAMTGEVTDTWAKNVTMTCAENNINGFFICGDSDYTISNSSVDFSGDGVNDFEGWGAAVQVADVSKVVLENTRITTSGVIRPCTSAVNASTLIVRNCELVGNGGAIDENTMPAVNGGMLVPPAPLGIGGNCRTHLSTGNSHSYFYDTKIVADGWAALSTDAGYGDLYIEANRCEITTRNSGYGTFSDGGCFLVLNDSKINTATHAMILAGRCKEKLTNTDVTSGKYGAMLFTVFGHGSEIAELTIHGGTVKTGDDCIWLKSTNAYLDFRGVNFQLGNGVLLHSVINDDPMATQVSPEDDLYGIKAVLSDMDVAGDILHEDTDRTMAVSLCHTKLSGAVRNAFLHMDDSSRWTATADSCVVIYGQTGGVDALPGVTINACSDTLEPQTLTLPSGGKLVVDEKIEPLPLPQKIGFE